MQLKNKEIFNPFNVTIKNTEKLILGFGHKYKYNFTMKSDNMITSLKESLSSFQSSLKSKINKSNSKKHKNDNRFIPSISKNFSLLPTTTEIENKSNNDNNSRDINYVKDMKKSIDNDNTNENHKGNINNMIDDYINECMNSLEYINMQNIITAKDRFILRNVNSILQKSNIIVKPADKNLGLVSLPLVEYKSLCNKILSDASTYKNIKDSNFVNVMIKQLHDILNRHDRFEISNKQNNNNNNSNNVQLQYMAKSLLQLVQNGSYKIAGKFYGLPKVHKPVLTIRPIISAKSTIPYYTSKYLHNVLIVLVKKLPSVCLNNIEILRDLDNKTLPNGACILCADVKDMYPSIPIEYGLKAVRFVMSQFQYLMDQLDFIIDLLAWTLHNNYFQFDNKFYLQIKGTAMGTPISVCYANITLYYLEQQVLMFIHPIYYKRFIDDLCVICVNTIQAENIIIAFNKQVPTIQLTTVTIGQAGIFLDMEISINAITNQIEYKLYQKEINKYLFIPPWSYHKRHIFTNIIKNEIKRIVLLNTCRINALNDLQRYRYRLKQRGYDESMLLPLFQIDQLPCREILITRLLSRLPNQDKRNIKNNNNDTKEIFPTIITHLPRIRAKMSLNTLFKLPTKITEHPSYLEVYGNNTKIRIINSTNKSINMTLNHRKDKRIDNNNNNNHNNNNNIDHNNKNKSSSNSE